MLINASSSTIILDKIKGSWMLDEEIELLMRENMHLEAIQRFVDAEKFAKAEEFCLKKDKQDRSLNLLTTLLTVYFQNY